LIDNKIDLIDNIIDWYTLITREYPQRFLYTFSYANIGIIIDIFKLFKNIFAVLWLNMK